VSVRDITVSDGKYTFHVEPDGTIEVLCPGVPWVTITQGCRAVAALLYRVAELEDAAKVAAPPPDPREEAFWSAAFCAAMPVMARAADGLDIDDDEVPAAIATGSAAMADAALDVWRKRWAK
jgi:hypothetical protein